jgi:hypothetical protein
MSFKEFSKKSIVACLSGKFNPFHSGHYHNWKILKKKFGEDSTFVCTSDKVDSDRPFNFEEKKTIITKLFFIDPKKVILTKNPYSPREILKDYPDETILVIAIGEKDRDRLTSSDYFEEYSKGSNKGYKEKAYFLILPNFQVPYKGKSKVLSSTMIRDSFRKAKTPEHQEEIFKSFYKDFNKKVFRTFVDKLGEKPYIIKEGGVLRHLPHPFEVETFTFKDLKDLIEQLLKGNVKVSEKIDGINLMFTSIDDEIRFSRGITQVKNFGMEAMFLKDLEDKFDDRKHLDITYTEAGEDLDKLLDSLSSEEKESIFKNGKVFLNAEVVNKKAINVIPYDRNFIRINGGFEYDEDGNVVDSSLDLDSLYSKLNKVKTDTYELEPIKNIYLNRVKNDSKEFLEAIEELEYSSGLSSTGLVKDASEDIKKELDSLFLRLGTVIIQNTFKNDSNKVKSIIEKMKEEANKIIKSNDKKDLKVLSEESDRLDIAGGFPSVNSNEGFVMNFKDILIKITGSFSPVNKIINLLKYK